MIRLVQPPRIWGLPNLSPPCMKLEAWLRMAAIPYEVAPLDLSKAPKGKVPYIHAEDGTTMGDSTLIIEHLTARHGRDLDAGLRTEQRAISLAFRRMMKENLYLVVVYSRYKDARNVESYRQMLIGSMDQLPAELRPVAADRLRKSVLDQLQGHGIGLLLGCFADPAFRARHVVLGQYLGIGALVAVSLVCSLISGCSPSASG